MSPKARRTRRPHEDCCTARQLVALPGKDHPIWKLGHKHVAIAHAICCAIAAAVNPNPESF